MSHVKTKATLHKLLKFAEGGMILVCLKKSFLIFAFKLVRFSYHVSLVKSWIPRTLLINNLFIL